VQSKERFPHSHSLHGGLRNTPKPKQQTDVYTKYLTLPLQYCERDNLAFIPWFPVAAGKLAKAGGPLDQIAKQHNATVAQISLAWLLHHSPVLVPIPGTSSVKHLEENMAAAKLQLSAAEWTAIESAAEKVKG
jgi:aryl-alcohol dehydrogenase-like predicted oxidoreductase